MNIGEIHVTKKFERQYKLLPDRVKEFAKEKEIVFKNNPFDPRLETHKLHGKKKEAWAFRSRARIALNSFFSRVTPSCF
ncbi:MAG: hypothetical protein A3D65_02090 [Candidatus Lloydbacteria bacterium RIFCSPHIGHO2_02_FULL_50_13]|uniref:Uncharacterized protein n=1 Tax=Candidatus Lloydbacteria bacterium RIFCSPHIGHO2_02_FULL_50_13 TaxID=1798661 RepID=A0A1G2CZ74_9BACT|nr:MAG: hypothetical protein A3D65_02090 [Candidatus Lloydbacteria bacterium RIFCSPHIGHO2_02_FULL_50_13]